MRLEKIITINGKIKCITGLCIGGSSNALEIGGISQEVIKNPLTKEPYIPGSSLKGKMRSELEKRYGSRNWDNNTKEYVIDEVYPCGCGKKDCLICCVFGAHKNPKAKSAPTRIIVRDAVLSEESRRIIKDLPIDHGSYLERKVENMVKRNSGTADAPRTIERVPSGISFDFEIILRVFAGDPEKEMLAFVEEGLKMVEASYMGGSGSRGYGKVEFDYVIQSDEKDEGGGHVTAGEQTV